LHRRGGVPEGPFGEKRNGVQRGERKTGNAGMWGCIVETDEVTERYMQKGEKKKLPKAG